MDSIQAVNEAAQKEEVVQIVSRYEIPHFLNRFTVKFDETWDGDPAIHVLYYGPMLYRPTEDELDWLDRLVESISAEIGVIVPDRPAYVRFVAEPASAT